MRKDLYRKQIDDCAVRAVQGAVRYKLAVAKYRRQQAQQALESAPSAMSLLPNSGKSVEAFVSWLMCYLCLIDVLRLLSHPWSRSVQLPGRLGAFCSSMLVSSACDHIASPRVHLLEILYCLSPAWVYLLDLEGH